MIEKLEPAIAGVVCLHCGMHTPLPNLSNLGRSEHTVTTSGPKIALVRCIWCGKEAPYLADEIVVLTSIPNVASHVA
jgi:hypothetical protein